MKNRVTKRKNKIKCKIKALLLSVIFFIIGYTILGIYKENKIALREKNENASITKENIIQNQTVNNKVSVIKEIIPSDYMGFEVAAKLIIPKINLETNVLQEYTTNGMKLCASKFWGPEANEVGNFCIAGHNYDEENMFNHLIDLEIGDKLYLTDNKNGKFVYTIYDIYRVKPQNTCPIEQQTNGKRVVTLITCVNYSRSRLIVQAIENT